ncbi:uncharacterized protein LOC144386366 [Gasterosteus aculeatus]
MSTRQKTKAADPGQKEDQDDGNQQGTAGGQPHERESITELSRLMKSLMQQQADRDSRTEHEHKRQEERWKRIQHQFVQLQQEVTQDRQARQYPQEGAAATPSHFIGLTADPPQIQDRPGDEQHLAAGGTHASSVRVSGWKSPKMQPYQEGEDIEHYLITFERIAHACQWPQDEWALHLASLLTGKARYAYVAMDIDDTMDYAKVKGAVLQKFEISAETYRVRFRATVPGEGETPKELQVRLKDLFSKWMSPEAKTKEQIGDTIIMEQFLKILNPELCTWIKERNPKSSKEAAELAEVFLAARRSAKEYLPPTPSSRAVSNELRANTGHSFLPSNSVARESRNKALFACHACGQKGHFKAECPRLRVSNNYMCFAPQLHSNELERSRNCKRRNLQ